MALPATGPTRLAFVAALLLPLTAFTAGPAEAQSASAYRAGLRIAQSRHYADPDCYARIFARHAQRKSHAQRGEYWSARAGRAFTGELWSQCGISR